MTKRPRRVEPPAPPPEDPRRLRGTITTILTGKGYGWISSGGGFVEPEGGRQADSQEVYFHFSGVDAAHRIGRGIDLSPGDEVTFLVVETARGSRAVKVRKG